MPENTPTTPKNELAARFGLTSSDMRLVRIIGWSVAGLLGFFVAAMVGAKYFPETVRSIGLGFLVNEESGVYANCSKSQNRNNPYCRGKTSPREREWKGLGDRGGGSSAFSLH
ncbi:MAG: hypothetical protein K1X79_02625 [Oligoflexia bacterium]|nr:hypothetical protein [Oligoflexia bacterium]